MYGAFVWVCRALNCPKRRFPTRAVALSSIPPALDSALITFTVFVCALLVLPVREVYLRSDFDQSEKKGALN